MEHPMRFELTLVGLLVKISKDTFIFTDEKLYWVNYLIFLAESKGVHTFSKGICPKGNVITRLEFELANDDVTVQHGESNWLPYYFCSELYVLKYFSLILIMI